MKVYRTIYTDGQVKYTVEKPEIKTTNSMTSSKQYVDGDVRQPVKSRVVNLKNAYVAVRGEVIREISGKRYDQWGSRIY